MTIIQLYTSDIHCNESKRIVYHPVTCETELDEFNYIQEESIKHFMKVVTSGDFNSTVAFEKEFKKLLSHIKKCKSYSHDNAEIRTWLLIIHISDLTRFMFKNRLKGTHGQLWFNYEVIVP